MGAFEEAANRMSGSKRPITTMFMLISVDGKISTGCSSARDFDSDFAVIDGLSAGLKQYYDIEKTTDEWTLCTGLTKTKIGINDVKDYVEPVPAKIAIIDNHNLTRIGVENLCKQYERVVVFTHNNYHPAMGITDGKLSTCYMDSVTVEDVLARLKSYYGVDELTLQTGGYTNGELIHGGLVDYIDFVIAPVIIGGVNTPSVVGGKSFQTFEELKQMAILECLSVTVLKDNYVRMRYKVVNNRRN